MIGLPPPHGDYYLISRPMQLQPCTRCAAHILVAIDQGTTIRTDIHSLNIHAEIAALLCGKATYEIWTEGSRKAYIHHRHIFRIASGNRENAIVADHVCPDGQRPRAQAWAEPRHLPGAKPPPKDKLKAAPVYDKEFPF